MKYLSFFLLLALAAHPAAAQQTPAAIKMDYMRMVDSIVKARQNQRRPGARNDPSTVGRLNKDSASLANFKLPPRNARLLAIIPKKRLTREQLKAWLAGFNRNIRPVLKSYGAKSPGSAPDPSGTTALSALLTGDKPTAISEALDGAMADPTDLSGLTNLGALLTECDLPAQAITVLEHVDSLEPGNSTVENNLGQAYIELGETARAEGYLRQAAANSPDHPLANLSLAYIDISRGDQAAALDHVKHSIAGGFNGHNWTLLKRIEDADPAKRDNIHNQTKLMDLIRHRCKTPSVLSVDKYVLPPQCRTPDELSNLINEYDAFGRKIHDDVTLYDKLARDEEDLAQKNISEKQKSLANQFDPSKMSMSQMMQKSQSMQGQLKTLLSAMPGQRPFGLFAYAVITDLTLHYGDDMVLLAHRDELSEDSLKALRDKYQEEEEKIIKSFDMRNDAFGEGNPDMSINKDMCGQINSLAADYMGRIAPIIEARQADRLEKEKDYLNDMAFWNYVASADDHAYNAWFYGAVSGFLSNLNHMAHTSFLGCTTNKDKTEHHGPVFQFTPGKCPLASRGANSKARSALSIDLECEVSDNSKDNLASRNMVGYAGDAIVTVSPGKGSIPVFGKGDGRSVIISGQKKAMDVNTTWQPGMEAVAGAGANYFGFQTLIPQNGKPTMRDLSTAWPAAVGFYHF